MRKIELFNISRKIVLRIEYLTDDKVGWLDFFTADGIKSVKFDDDELEDIIDKIVEFMGEKK